MFPEQNNYLDRACYLLSTFNDRYAHFLNLPKVRVIPIESRLVIGQTWIERNHDIIEQLIEQNYLNPQEVKYIA